MTLPTDDYIRCNTDGSGKMVRTRKQTIGANEVHTEIDGLEDVAGNQVNPASMAGTPAIYNVTMTNANTEYNQALPANCKKFLIHTRDGTSFRLAFVTGKVATPTEPYFTIPASVPYWEDLVQPGSATLYFACAVAGKVVEIIAWS